MNRRDFFKKTAKGAVATAAIATTASAAGPKEKFQISDETVGILYDSTICVGCNACMSGCKKANDLDRTKFHGEMAWDKPTDLDGDNMNIIRMFTDGTGETQNQEKDGFAFIKGQCLHCIEPGCVAACPTTALLKNGRSGVVEYVASHCIGCRYCQVGCPWDIPKFEWDDWYPEIIKCQLCDHLLEKGELPGCCSTCPTGASLFGPVSKLSKEAHRRLQMKEGERYEYPVFGIESNHTLKHRAAKYINQVYGESELGGTQVTFLSSVPFKKLGLPEFPDKSFSGTSDGIQTALYTGFIFPAAILATYSTVIYKNLKKEREEEEAKREAKLSKKEDKDA